MSDTVQNILAILGTVFNMITTMLFYKACLGNKKIRVNKILFFVTFILAFGIGLVLSQVGYVGLFYSIMSFAIFFGLTLLYQSKWIIRIFTAVSYLAFSMISELISYSTVLSTIPFFIGGILCSFYMKEKHNIKLKDYLNKPNGKISLYTILVFQDRFNSYKHLTRGKACNITA